jgi:hypothetical protein
MRGLLQQRSLRSCRALPQGKRWESAPDTPHLIPAERTRNPPPTGTFQVDRLDPLQGNKVAKSLQVAVWCGPQRRRLKSFTRSKRPMALYELRTYTQSAQWRRP